MAKKNVLPGGSRFKSHTREVASGRPSGIETCQINLQNCGSTDWQPQTQGQTETSATNYIIGKAALLIRGISYTQVTVS